jgi:flagellin
VSIAQLSSGKLASTEVSGGTFASTNVSAANHNNKIMISVDGGTAHALTIADGTYSTVAAYQTAIQNAITADTANFAGRITASFDAGNSNKLTLTSDATGATSAVTLTAATYATGGSVASTFTPAGTFGDVTVNPANHNNTIGIAADNGAIQQLTIATGTYSSGQDFLTAIQTAITGQGITGVTAGIDANGKVSITSTSTGTTSKVSLTNGTYTINAESQSSITSGSAGPFTVGTGDNTFMVAVNGGASTLVTVGTGTYTAASDLVTAINSAVTGAGLTASLDATNHIGIFSAGSTASVTLSAAGGSTFLADFNFGTSTHTGSVGSSTGLTAMGFTGSTSNSGSNSVDNTLLTNAGFAPGSSTGQTAVNAGLTNLGLGTGSLTRGTDDAPTTVQSIANQINNSIGSFAKVSVASDGTLSIESLSKGANSSVTLNHVTSNSAYTGLHLNEGTATGQNETITDVVNDLNAQFSSTALQAAGLTASATNASNTGAGTFITISSANGNQTQFRLDSLGGGSTGTSGAVGSTMTQGSYTPITVTASSNDSFRVAVDSGSAQTLTMATGTYSTASALLTAVQDAIRGSTVNGMVTAGWDATSDALTFTSVNTGTGSIVTLSANGGNTGLTALGFTGTLTNTGTGSHTSAVEDIGFGAQGSTFVGAAPSSTGTTMSTQLAGGVSNSLAFDFSALKYGSDKQALTFSATDANGAIETKTITLQNNASANRAGVSIDDAVAYINTQLQASTDKPALQSIVAVKQANTGSTAEQINFVSKLTGFTVGVSATANGDGLNSGAATYRKSEVYGTAANITIDTQAGAKAAITAIGSAVSSLGVAQAAVGKGENQLAYAITLAQSQITNFSAAESQIRDTDVAQQAANLSKAQVLQQSSIAAMAQANSAPQAVLSLLKG